MVRPQIKKKIFKGQIEKNKMIEKTKLVRGKIGRKVGGKKIWLGAKSEKKIFKVKIEKN